MRAFRDQKKSDEHQASKFLHLPKICEHDARDLWGAVGKNIRFVSHVFELI